MKKLLLLMASSLMLTATTTYAQSVKAYKNGNATDYSFSSLNYGTLNNVDSIVVSGTLNSSNITLLHNALGENANYSLLKADFSNAVFSTNKLDSLFNCFFGLESVIFPNATNNNSISMESMFYKCSALKSIVNLDKLTNITSLFATFYMCENLTSIKFSSTTNNNAVSFSGCFVTCSSLTEIENLEKFTNITDITTAFYGCSKLGIIRLSNIPEQYTMAFSSCNAYIFLPDGMTDYPNNITWTNVVLEMTSVSMSKKATFTEDSTITLPTFSIEPESMKKFIKGTKYQLSNDGFATFEEYTPNTNVTKDYSGYKLRVGVTNPRMTGYIYSEPVDVEKLPFKVTAYFGKTAKKYATEQLDYGTLASADSIIAYGTWVSRDASQLRRAIVKSSDDMTNDKTKKVDMSEVEISESSSFTGFQKLFMNATALETIILPNTPNESYNIISMCNNCTNLKTILNFEKLTSVTFAEKAFYNCSKLKEIHLGSKSNLAYNGTDIFTGCNALKYMPDGVTTLGSNLQNYNNFVLPFTSASLSGTASFNIGDVFVLPTINPTPAYCAATDIVYELSNDDFATKETYTPNTIVTKDYTGYKMRIGAKNASMTDYVYSSAIAVSKTEYKLTAHTGGVSTKYSIEQLETGTLAQVDSIVVYGSWNDDNLIKLRTALKSDGDIFTYNHSLKAVNMNNTTFIDSYYYIGFMFSHCDSLKSVSLPSNAFTGGIDLSGVFEYCETLNNIENLDKLQNITCLYRTFSDCKKLTNVKFADTENKNAIGFSQTFFDCSSLENIDLSPFNNINNLFNTFGDCLSLKTVKFSVEDNNNDVNCSIAFESCIKLKTIENLDKFKKMYDFRRTFNNCVLLGTIKLGTDPNTESAKVTDGWSSSSEEANQPFYLTFYNCQASVYLPNTVTTIPEKWHSYTNFVLPITSVTQTGTAGIVKEGGVVTTPDAITATPAYCTMTDTVFQLSNNNFSTYTSFKKGEVLKGNYVGYQLRVGVKNQSMSNYVYSTTSIKVDEIIPLIAYRNGTATEYSFSAIKPGILADAERIELYGAWTDTDLLNLQKALKKNWSTQNNEENSTLVNADLSKVSFSGNVSNTSRLFKNCTALIEVQLPSATIANGISLSSTFSGCTLLKYVLNLEKLDNIVKIDSAFFNCKTIESLMFSAVANTAKIDFSSTFNGCSFLSGITNLASFQNISCLAYAFANCNNLGYIILGVDPNKLAETNIIGTFDGCLYTHKYLPDGVDTIPTIWQKANYNNFAVPFKSIDADIVAYMTEDGEAKVSLQSIAINPSYALSNYNTWQYSNDNFATTSSLSDMTAGFKAVYGVMNSSMSDYIYSDTVTATTLTTNVIVYRGKSKSTYKASTLEDGLLCDADSIVVEGSWNDDNLIKLRTALKSDGDIFTYNHSLKNADMSNATFIGEISNGMKYMFYECDSLEKVILPSSVFTGKISLSCTFKYCITLKSVENLDNLQNITYLDNTFNYCEKLANVNFSKTDNSNRVSLADVFYNCEKLENIDLSSFKNITNLCSTFEGCSSLETVKFPGEENNNDVNCSVAFESCIKLTTIENFDKFKKLYDFRYTFNGCNSLGTIKLGTDPNTESAKVTDRWSSSLEEANQPFYLTFYNCNAIKYLPEGVTTIPAEWQSFNNFVLPIDSVVVTGKGMTMNSGSAIMPAFTTYPSYVVATDTIWQLSADGFKTVIDYNANTQVDFSMYALRCGVKNQSMSDYVYSKNDVQFEKIECYVKAYIAGGVKTYVPNDLAVGTLAKADSVFLFGKWNDNFVQKFAKSLKTSWDAPSSESFSGNNVTNSILKKIDMSDLTHTDTIFNGSLCIFHNCEELETVILPQQQLAKWGFGLYGAFNGCTKLKNVINLDKIKTYSIQGAFMNCTSLESVTFCKEPITDGKYKLISIFEGCTNLKHVYNFGSNGQIW